jgi:predicted DNA-binding WGR domain protein
MATLPLWIFNDMTSLCSTEPSENLIEISPRGLPCRPAIKPEWCRGLVPIVRRQHRANSDGMAHPILVSVHRNKPPAPLAPVVPHELRASKSNRVDTLLLILYHAGSNPAPEGAVLLAAADSSRYTSRDDMPKRRQPASVWPTPIQLPLFAETASLVRIRPALNEWRYYRMEVWPDLFGRALLVRQWGRIGTEGRRRLDPHPDPGAAINALADILRAKRRRGYQDRTA